MVDEVAREQQVVERLQQVAVVVDALPLRVLIALDEHPGQLAVAHAHELLGQSVVGAARQLDGPVAVVEHALVDQVGLDLLVLQQLFEDVLDVVDLCPLLQHPAEAPVLYVDVHAVENVAVEGVGTVHGRHALNLDAWAVQQHGPQPSGLGRDIDWTSIKPTQALPRGGMFNYIIVFIVHAFCYCTFCLYYLLHFPALFFSTTN